MADGLPRFLLITSRDTKRWVIPRGNPIAGLSPFLSAAQEAFEEAGVRGNVATEPVGSYVYDKRRKDGSAVPVEVGVYPMEVTREEEDWPERHQRDLAWFDPAGAVDAVEEPGLKALLASFRPPVPNISA